jgi:hypothetical protein
MEQVMDCNPPLRKLGKVEIKFIRLAINFFKYKWRMEKNFKNALFHLQNENCIYKNEYEPPKRYNRGQNMFTDRFFAKLIEQAQKRKIAKTWFTQKFE